MTGMYGKLPSYGDFVRRGLPQSYLGPWDEWLQSVVGTAVATLGEGFAATWAAAPCWRFHLPAGICGDSQVVGVFVASVDSVGREFPLTLASLLPETSSRPHEQWFDSLEQAGRQARDEGQSVDDLLARLPEARENPMTRPPGAFLDLGWWTNDGKRLPLTALPAPDQFVALLRGQADDAALVSQAATHPGTVRRTNEDAYVERGDIGLWAVADGAGGHGSGDKASSAVAAALKSLPPALSAGEVLAQVRQRLALVHEELKKMGSGDAQDLNPATTVVVLLARDDHFACLWAGDSRVYLMREGVLCQLTEDHSLVQELLNASLVKPEDVDSHPQANVITRAVGGDEDLVLDKVSGRLLSGDRFLLCSDGLFKAISEAVITQVLLAGGGANDLLQCSLAEGARDNVTALVVGARARK